MLPITQDMSRNNKRFQVACRDRGIPSLVMASVDHVLTMKHFALWVLWENSGFIISCISVKIPRKTVLQVSGTFRLAARDTLPYKIPEGNLLGAASSCDDIVACAFELRIY